MGSIATQTTVGEIGSKAVTELSYSFASMINVRGFQYGGNSEGLHRLNVEDPAAATTFTRTFTLATTDFGIKVPKRARFLSIGFDADDAFTVSVKLDDKTWRDYPVVPLTTGLQRIRVTIGSSGQGRYFTIKVSSTSKFRIDNIIALFTARTSRVMRY